MNNELRMTTTKGIILQSIGGFYYVEAADAVYTCRAKGAFRNQKMTPLAGDWVEIITQEDGSGTLQKIMERRNYLIRPAVANVDILVIVASVCDPLPNLLILDKMIASAEYRGIEPILVVNKADLADGQWLADIYRLAGFETYTLTAFDAQGAGSLRQRLSQKVCVFTGNSGVGKSTLLNILAPGLMLTTGETSRKLGRGKHTTRSASLYKLPEGGYLVDTPGFSSLDLARTDDFTAQELPDCFREFRSCIGRCRFTSCAHVKEAGCAVRQAVQDGKIAVSRHESYISMYNEVKNRRDWDKPKKTNA